MTFGTREHRTKKLPNNGIIRIIMQEWNGTEQSLSLSFSVVLVTAIFESFISKFGVVVN